MATVTVHTTLKLDPATRPQDAAVLAALDDWAVVTGQCQRTLHAMRMAGHGLNDIKKCLTRRFGLTHRHFSGLRADYDGKVRSARTGQQRRRDTLKRQIARNTERLTWCQQQGLTDRVAQLAARGVLLADRLARAEAALRRPPALCFGSKKLFHAQYHLEANGFADHAAWQQAWRAARSREIPLIGSKDETAGNQSCQYDPAQQTLTVRVPDRIAAAHQLPAQLVLQHVTFGRDPALLAGALTRATAISYRFQRVEVTTRSGRPTGRTRWRLFATCEVPGAKLITEAARGAVGFDLNVDHLAWCRVDPSGNPVAWGRTPLLLTGRRRTQVQQDISTAVAPLVEMAKQHKVPLIHEDLDLTAKQDQRRGRHRGTNRKLSSLATKQIVSLCHSKASPLGVQVVAVNPAYTSIIGDAKFATGYGRSRHQAAACVIARRGQYQELHPQPTPNEDRRPSVVRGRRGAQGESLRARVGTPPAAGHSIQGAAPRPVRTRGVDPWKDWARFAQRLASWEAARRAVARAAGGGASKATGRRRTVRRSVSPAGPRARPGRRT